jgi:tetratricopeptide (TPR) repeat protein
MNHLGYTWAERGQRLDEALKLIKRAVELDPENGAYLDSLGWVYYQMGDAKRALPWMLKAAAKLPDDPVILEHLGDVYAKLGLVPQALDAWTRALTKSSAPSESLRQKIQSLSPTPHQPRS